MKAGDRLPKLRIGPVSADKMKIMAAILRDPNPIHWDHAELRARGLGDKLINQGPVNLGYVANMLAVAAGGYDRVRRMTVRFDANVLEGDHLVAGGLVTEVRDGVAHCDVWLDRADGTRAVAGTAEIVAD
jgi:acyl dehydratase